MAHDYPDPLCIKAINFWPVIAGPAAKDDLKFNVFAALIQNRARYFQQFKLPTEIVLRAGDRMETLNFNIGRCYWHFREVEDTRDANGVTYAKWTSLLEVWEDYGDDGRISYALHGWAEVSAADASKYVDAANSATGYDHPFPQIDYQQPWEDYEPQ